MTRSELLHYGGRTVICHHGALIKKVSAASTELRIFGVLGPHFLYTAHKFHLGWMSWWFILLRKWLAINSSEDKDYCTTCHTASRHRWAHVELWIWNLRQRHSTKQQTVHSRIRKWSNFGIWGTKYKQTAKRLDGKCADMLENNLRYDTISWGSSLLHASFVAPTKCWSKINGKDSCYGS